MKIWHWVIFLIATDAVSGIMINEIMYNPEGADTGKEYIEIAGTNNLSHYSIGDNNYNDTLHHLRTGINNISLILEENYVINVTGVNSSIYYVEGKIGNGMGNSGDTIYLYLNRTLIHEVAYEDRASEGRSLENRNGSFVESLVDGGTPGRKNSQLTTKSEVSNQTENKTSSLCNVTLELEVEDSLYENGDTIFFHNILSSETYPYIIKYGIEDLQGNIVKEYRNTSNTNEKRFTPNVKDGYEKSFVIKSRLARVNCTNTAEQEMLKDEKIVSVINRNYKPEEITKEDFCREEIKKIGNLTGTVEQMSILEEKEKKEEVEIKSFYSRKKKYEPNITIYYSIEGDGHYELVLTSQLENQSRKIDVDVSERDSIAVKAKAGRNLYVLEIKKEGEVLDIEKLMVELEGEEETVREIESKKENYIEKVEVVIEQEKEEDKKITGSVVYETKSYGEHLAVASIMLLVIIIGSISYSLWKEKKNPAETQTMLDDHRQIL